MSKEFTKNELATYIASWNNKGAVAFRQVRVHSCGVKQMCLHDAETDMMLGHHFAPVVSSNELHERGCFNWGGTFKKLSDDEAEKLALEMGAKIIKSVIASLEKILESGYGADSRGYQDGIREQLTEIKTRTPSVINRTGDEYS